MLDIKKTVQVVVFFIKKKGNNHTCIETERLIRLLFLSEFHILNTKNKSLIVSKGSTINDIPELSELDDIISGLSFNADWDNFLKTIHLNRSSEKNNTLVYLHKDITKLDNEFFTELDQCDLDILEYIYDNYHEKNNLELKQDCLAISRKIIQQPREIFL